MNRLSALLTGLLLLSASLNIVLLKETAQAYGKLDKAQRDHEETIRKNDEWLETIRARHAQMKADIDEINRRLAQCRPCP